MASCSLKDNCLVVSPPPGFTLRPMTTVVGHASRRYQESSLVPSRTKGQAFRILATSNVSPPGKGNRKNEVIMVDPLEAKRLAAKQLQEIQAKERFERKRRVEAINGTWAMIGLTAGLVVEGETGKSILAQLVNYWSALISLFVK